MVMKNVQLHSKIGMIKESNCRIGLKEVEDKLLVILVNNRKSGIFDQAIKLLMNYTEYDYELTIQVGAI